MYGVEEVKMECYGLREGFGQRCEAVCRAGVLWEVARVGNKSFFQVLIHITDRI